MRRTTGAFTGSGTRSFVSFSRAYPYGVRPLIHLPSRTRRSSPAVTRSTMVACSNSAKTPSICSIIRPAGEPVSNGSVADFRTTSKLVELLAQAGELPHLPAEAVDAVDEQQVDALLTRQLECLLQAGTVEAGAGGLVFVGGDDAPVLHRLAVALQPLPLRLERGWLVVLIGRDPLIQTDAHHGLSTSSGSWSSMEPSIAAGVKSHPPIAAGASRGTASSSRAGCGERRARRPLQAAFTSLPLSAAYVASSTRVGKPLLCTRFAPC